ncbi:NUDIX hydrolase [Patescibacteria group bacterium]|nr:NUDIX hydrolase [Patescibacteria group bacterium]
MVATRISLDNAKQNKLFYFVGNVVVYRESDGRCLILKRDEREKVHPGRWSMPGGKLEWGDIDLNHPTNINGGTVLDYNDMLEDLLRREAKEEANVEIDTTDLVYINSVAFVRPDEIPVMMVKVAAKYLGGEVIPEKGGFTAYAWVNATEVKNYPCIDGIPEEVAKTIQLFGSRVVA